MQRRCVITVVGTAYVAVKVISDNLSKDIKRSVKKSLKDVDADIDKMGKEVGKDLSESIGDSVEKNLTPELKKTVRNVQKNTKRDFDRGFSEIGRSIGDSIGFGFKKRIGPIFDGIEADLKTKTRSMGGGLRRYLIPIIISALSPLVQVVGAYIAEATALIAQLGPALGASALVAAGGLAALASAGAAVILALKTQTPMLERFKEVASSVGAEFRIIGESVQRELLPRLGAAMVLLTDTIPVLEEGLTSVGKSVGQVAEEFARMLTEADNLERLGNILESSATVTYDLGFATSALTETTLILLDAARPLTEEFARYVRTLAEGWTASLEAAEATGELAAWMERAGEIAKQLGRIFSGFFGGLAGVFRASADAGADLLDRIEASATRFDEWANSIAGQNTLKAWFEDSSEVASAFNDLLKEIGGFLGDLFTQDPEGTVQFINALQDLVSNLRDAAPGLTALATSIAEILAAMSDTGALTVLIGLFNALAQALLFILQIPIVGHVLVLLGVFSKLASIFTGFTAMSIFLNALKLLGQAALFLGRVLLTTVIPALWAMIAPLLANPITWIVLGILALIAAIVLLIVYWDEVKEAALAVWDAIKEAVGVAWEFIKGIWDGVVEFFTGIWDSILETVSGFVQGVIDFFQPLIDFFTNIAETVFGAFIAAWQIMFTILLLPVRIFVGLVIALFQWLFNALKGPINAVKDFIVKAWNAVKDAVTKVVTALANWLKGIWNTVKNWIVNIVTAMKDGIKRVWDRVQSVLETPIKRARDFIRSAVNTIKGFFSGLWSAVKSGAETMASAIRNAINGVIGLVNGAIGGINTVIRTANKLPGPDLPQISTIPRLASGGVVSPYNGGTLAMIAEAGRPERVEPLDSNGLSKRDYALIEALTMSATANVKVYIGDTELRDIVRTEVQEEDNETALVLAGGRRL